ncbi:MAG: cytochrome c3 family protein [Deltaproteobacteria bacterium]|nr:cytochrome c3 family protein [Deltaproteobacteria bacterium]MBW1911085.1 cytochrome c3 family protein [Deltaproteobacteria bacterium]MBW2034896.1 cytochrome c3 family protein [Deltaproteobacteria bacterium]
MRWFIWPKFRFLAFVSLLIFVLLTTFSKADIVQIVRVESSRSTKTTPGDCTFCHQDKSQLPGGHPQTKEMTLTQCNQCHNQQATTLASILPLSHLHQLEGLSCEDCHDSIESVQPIDTQKCLQCHGTFHDVAACTKDMNPNPHDSHLGIELDCRLCHHVHKKSENFCNRCHEHEWKVP